MTTDTVPSLTRLTILSSGVRIVRLGPADAEWLREYEKILRVSAQDFLRRAHQAGTPEGLIEDLGRALGTPHRAVWFVLQADYRFLGFALAEIVQEFDATPRAYVQAAYLYPRRTPRSVLPALTQVISAWATAWGATALDFQTRRDTAGAWWRVGARPVAMVYRVPITQGDGNDGR